METVIVRETRNTWHNYQYFNRKPKQCDRKRSEWKCHRCRHERRQTKLNRFVIRWQTMWRREFDDNKQQKKCEQQNNSISFVSFSQVEKLHDFFVSFFFRERFYYVFHTNNYWIKPLSLSQIHEKAFIVFSLVQSSFFFFFALIFYFYENKSIVELY